MSDIPTGSLNSYTTFYRSPEDEGDECTWMKEEPEDVADAAEDEETAQHAFILRVEKANDSRKKYQLHSIIIQSEHLKHALGEIFQDYPGVSCSLKRLEFEAPFKPFVHRWLGLLKFKNKQGIEEETAKHLNLLHGVLKNELKDVLEAVEDYGKHGVITYDHVWTLYPPGSIVYTQRIHGAPGAMRVKGGEYCEMCGRPAFSLQVEMVDFNGSDFCLTSYEEINIRPFVGTTKILNLAALPLSFHPYEEKIRAAFIQRGKIFEELTGTHYKEYDGVAVTWDAERNEVPTTCDGRIIVDHEAFRRFSDQYLDSMDPLEHGEGLMDPEGTTETPEEEDVDRYIFGKQDKHNKLVRLKEEHHLICSPRVRGYSIKKKQWLLFFVDLISEVTFNENAFASLVLPEDQKELILSFAESQALNSDTIFDDIISGKGRGHITLLSGPPGVGKTLTAESVAEHMHAPLYMMSAGDLGSTPADVDRNLTQILDMIQRWKAVLLLDECDVFLEARTSSELERNQMVSIFLRTLEYYQGILFLTSNRIDNIDSAFQSRIHISMAYPDLTEDARRQIWQNFLRSVHLEQVWEDKDFDELSRVELNGRQIKNVVKSAALLSKRRKEPLSRKYVDWVMEIEKRRPGMHGEGKLGDEVVVVKNV